MSAPETIDYVVVPVNRDEGEMEFKGADGKLVIVQLDLADLGSGVTAVLAPVDLSDDHAVRLMDMLKRRQRESNGDTKFVLLQSGNDPDAPRWDFLRLIRKDKWDADFGEACVEPTTT